MQVQNQAQENNNFHQILTDTVSDLYDGIDSIIEAAKTYVRSENTQDADKLVEYIDSYVTYMHKLIDTIVNNYTGLFKIPEDQQNDSEESFIKTPTQEEMRDFQELFSNCLEYAGNATQKVQKKLASALESDQS